MYAWTVSLAKTNQPMMPTHPVALIDVIGYSPSEVFHQYTYSCTGHERLAGVYIP